MKKLESQLLQAAVEVQSALTDLGHRFCIIGGLAVSRWGEPRTTQDVDVSLLVEIGDEQRVSKKVLSRLRPRFSYSLDLALKQRIILAVAANDVGVDIALASFPFEYRVIETGFELEVRSNNHNHDCICGRPRSSQSVCRTSERLARHSRSLDSPAGQVELGNDRARTQRTDRASSRGRHAGPTDRNPSPN